METKLFRHSVAALIAGTGLYATNALAASLPSYDLTTTGSSATINGGHFQQVNPQPTGSGVIDSFVRINPGGNSPTLPAGSEEGYNATVRPVMPDVNTSPTFTRDIQLSAVPIVVNPAGAAAGSYYQFLLDINQTGADPLLSLDELQIFTRNTALASASTLSDLTGSSDLRYNLDGNGETYVLLNYSLNSGSGSGDMLAYIPVGNFAGDALTDYVYLYSKFGATDPHQQNAGYEEWATVRGTNPPVPEPAEYAMIGLGIAGLGFGYRRLKRQVA